MKIKDQSYIIRILVSLDNTLNVVLSPLCNWYYNTDKFGSPDECVSSVLGKLQREGHDTRFRKIVDWFFYKYLGEVDHCINNIEEDEGNI